MHRLRRDAIYLALGITVTFAVLLAIAVTLGFVLVLAMAFAPGRFRELLQELLPAGVHVALVLAALLEGIYVYLLRLARFLSKRFSGALILLMGAIALISLILGLLAWLFR